MRPSTLLLSAAALAGSVLADGESIRNAMKKISDDTAALGNIVSGWPGDPLGAFPIAIRTGGLLHTIKQGTSVAEESKPLSTDEALQVATSTQDLSKAVNKTLVALIDARPKFANFLATPLIRLSLHSQRDAAKEFSDKVIEKVPKDLQSVAQSLVKGIDDGFEKAIDEYS
ncbi:hypothetical protein HIM_00809 [Hirsutella minnesotensis 3608]|nr:hypothetical protein HIM_00809 [Hirsutella minnesotensis 3608]